MSDTIVVGQGTFSPGWSHQPGLKMFLSRTLIGSRLLFILGKWPKACSVVVKTSALRARISSFRQKAEETIPEAWECLQEYIRECPHHGIKEWLLIQGFYHGLTPDACSHLDAAARGSFTSLNVAQAKKLIENIVTNQEWNDECPKPKKRGTHTIEEVKAISQNMELLMKKIEETSNFKKEWALQETS